MLTYAWMQQFATLGLVALVASIGCGGDDPATGSGQLGGSFLVACDNPAGTKLPARVHSCVDHYAKKSNAGARKALELSCTSNGGTLLDTPCPDADKVGACLVKQPGTWDLYGIYSLQWMYPPTTEESTRSTCHGGDEDFVLPDGTREPPPEHDPDAGGAGDAMTAGDESKVALDDEAIAVATGGSHACAILRDGTVACWGANDQGQLGNGTRMNSPKSAPVAVKELRAAKQLALSSVTSCVLVDDGAVWCWGRGFQGELGNGTRQDSQLPVAVSGLTDAVAISAGFQRFCAVRADDTVSCWGAEIDAKQSLRDPVIGYALTPVPVPNLGQVKSVALEKGNAYALHADGKLTAWDRYWQPKPVTELTGVVAIDSSLDHTCAVLDSGRVRCWGLSPYGQLGIAGATSRTLKEKDDVPGIDDASAISVGGNTSCATRSDGSVTCWGSVLALTGTALIGDKLPPSDVPEFADLASLDVGTSLTCGLTTEGIVHCW